MRRRLTVLLAGLALAAGAIGVACTDLPSDPKVPFSIELRAPGSPSVVLGDTLRDSLGLVAPLRATAFNVDGDSIAGAPVVYRIVPVGIAATPTSPAIDSTPAKIDASGRLVVARRERVFTTRTFRVYAEVSGIQTAPIPLTVTRRPDAFIVTDSVVTMTLSFRDSVPVSPDLTVRLKHTPIDSIGETAADTTVPAYLVLYRIVVPASAQTDTSYLMLTDGNRLSPRDTTDASGVASRKVRVRYVNNFPSKPAVNDTVTDSVRVEARAFQPGGTPVPGSPRQFLLIIKAPTVLVQ